MKISVHVKPHSKKESIEKLEDGTLVVKVNATPVEGKANKRVVELLADYFNRPKSCIELLHGKAGKNKIFVIH